MNAKEVVKKGYELFGKEKKNKKEAIEGVF